MNALDLPTNHQYPNKETIINKTSCMTNQISNLYDDVSVKNKDEQCFKWAFIAALHHEEIAEDPQSIS